MANQSFKRTKPGQKLERAPKSIAGADHRRLREGRSGSKLVVWLSLLACLVILSLVMIISQAGRSRRVYDDTIFIGSDTQPSVERPPETPTLRENISPENSGDLEALIRRIKPSVVFIEAVNSGEGSGFVIGSSGYVLTCHHVIERASRIMVIYTNSKGTARRASASLVWSQENRDLALICIDRVRNLATMKLGNAESVGQGHQIIAVGYPLGSSLGIEPTVTTGIISSIRQTSPGGTLFQISAAVNPGNSGGALISVETEQVIGIVDAKVPDAEGIGFAIPITHDLRSLLTRKYTR